MAKVTTSDENQVDHRAQECASANGKGVDHPVLCSVVPVQVPEGKQKCPDGTLHLQIVSSGKNVRRKFGPLYPIAYKVLG